MNEWCVKQHGATGLTQRCRESNILCQVRLGLETSYFVKIVRYYFYWKEK